MESTVIEPHLLVYYARKLMGEHHLPTLVVYRQPSDFPRDFVVRLFCDGRALSFCALAPSLEAARDMIPERHFVRMDRAPTDDPVIVETWV